MSKRLGKAAAFIAAAESGTSDQYCYEQAATLIEEEMRAKPGLTQREVATEIGKSQGYVQKLLKALNRARDSRQPFKVDWQSGSNKRKDVLEQTEPEALVEAVQKAIEQAEPEQRDALVEAVTDTSTVAGRHISNKVVAREAEKDEQAKPVPVVTGIPLPAMYASISVGIDKWARELSRFHDDDLAELAEANPDGAEQVAKTVDRLDTQVIRWLSRLRRRPDLKLVEDGNVIEGVARQR